MEYQDDQPSNHTTNSADEHGEHVDGYVVRQNKVRQQQENYPYNPVDDEVPQVASAAGKHQQDYYHHQYEYDYFHQLPFYTKDRCLKTRLAKSIGALKDPGTLSTAVSRI
jgi:hypothetical protein